MFFNQATELASCGEKRSAAAAHDTILLTIFRIGDRWRVANSTSKFRTHGFVSPNCHPLSACSAQRLYRKIVPKHAMVTATHRLQFRHGAA
jgi:hypothetical protein